MLVMRFGLADGKIHTLEQVGKHFKVTRERVRQLETKALAKLRQPSRPENSRITWRAAEHPVVPFPAFPG